MLTPLIWNTLTTMPIKPHVIFDLFLYLSHHTQWTCFCRHHKHSPKGTGRYLNALLITARCLSFFVLGIFLRVTARQTLHPHFRGKYQQYHTNSSLYSTECWITQHSRHQHVWHRLVELIMCGRRQNVVWVKSKSVSISLLTAIPKMKPRAKHWRATTTGTSIASSTQTACSNMPSKHVELFDSVPSW